MRFPTPHRPRHQPTGPARMWAPLDTIRTVDPLTRTVCVAVIATADRADRTRRPIDPDHPCAPKDHTE